MTIRSNAAIGAVAVTALMLGAASAPAVAAIGGGGSSTESSFYISYQVNGVAYTVTDIAMYEQGLGANGYGITVEDPPFTANNVGETTLTDPFLKTNPIISTFLIGVTSDLPGDAPGQQHLVLFTNTSWAQAAQHIAWGNLFGPLLEEDAISDVANVNWDSMFGDFTGLDQLNTSYAFAPGQAFDVIAFSNGQIIGSGTSYITNVPEPATWALMLAGFGGLAFAGLRGRRQPRLDV